MRRALAEMLVDVMDVAEPVQTADAILFVTAIYFDLPVQVAVRTAGDEIELLADLPRWRWTTVFDEKPGRLKVLCTPGGVS